MAAMNNSFWTTQAYYHPRYSEHDVQIRLLDACGVVDQSCHNFSTCYHFDTSSNFLPDAGYISLVYAFILLVSFWIVMSKISRHNRLALAGKTKEKEDTLCFSNHIMYLQCSAVWAILWAAYKLFSTNNKEGDTWKVYHAIATSTVMAISIFLELSLACYLFFAKYGTQSVKRAGMIAGVIVLVYYIISLTVFIERPPCSQRDPSRMIIKFYLTYYVVALLIYVSMFLYALVSTRRRSNPVHPHGALLRWSAFLIFYYATGMIARTLQLYRHDGGYCVMDFSGMVYFVLWIFVMYRVLLMDSNYWRNAFSGGSRLDLFPSISLAEPSFYEPANPYEQSLLPGNESLPREMMGPNEESVPSISGNQLAVIEKIGRGSVGEVYLYQYANREVAVKELAPRLCDEEMIEGFKREADIMNRVRHENVVEVIGIYVDPPRIGIVMEYCANGNLFQVISKCRSARVYADIVFAQTTPIHMALEIARGMQAIHRRNIIHRDLKSLNVLLDLKWRCKISDFGEALDHVVRVASGLRGTPPWMSPEALVTTQPEHVYPSTDTYSFAIILWELLTWEEPFIYDDYRSPVLITGVDIAHELVVERGSRPPIPRDCPAILSQLLQACWHQQPNERPRFEEIVSTLEEAERSVHGARFPLQV